MLRVTATLLVAAATLAAAPAHAQTPEEFYRGKTLNLIIPNAPGGSFDLYARLAASHLGRFIPGNPAIVPQNMPVRPACRPRTISPVSRPRTAPCWRCSFP